MKYGPLKDSIISSYTETWMNTYLRMNIDSQNGKPQKCTTN